MRIVTLALFAAVLLHAIGGVASAQTHKGGGSGPTFVLTQSESVHLGLKSERARAATYTPQVHGYGVVLNSSALAQLDADIEAARAAVQQSQASLDRSRRLFRTANAISHEALDATEHQARANDVQFSLADRKEVAMFGVDAPWRGATRNAALLSKIAAGSVVIVQATFPLDVRFVSGPSSFTVRHLSEQTTLAGIPSTSIWHAPSDPTIPGQSFYALIDGPDLEQGEHVVVYAPTGPMVSGARVPAEAVVIAAQRAWCYVMDAPLTFRRVAIDMSRPLAGGYFVTLGVAPNQPVLVKGTGLLLAREFGSVGYGPD